MKFIIGFVLIALGLILTLPHLPFLTVDGGEWARAYQEAPLSMAFGTVIGVLGGYQIGLAIGGLFRNGKS